MWAVPRGRILQGYFPTRANDLRAVSSSRPSNYGNKPCLPGGGLAGTLQLPLRETFFSFSSVVLLSPSTVSATVPRGSLSLPSVMQLARAIPSQIVSVSACFPEQL